MKNIKHYFLSIIATFFFFYSGTIYSMEYSSDNFPLPLQETIQLAKELMNEVYETAIKKGAYIKNTNMQTQAYNKLEKAIQFDEVLWMIDAFELLASHISNGNMNESKQLLNYFMSMVYHYAFAKNADLITANEVFAHNCGPLSGRLFSKLIEKSKHLSNQSIVMQRVGFTAINGAHEILILGPISFTLFGTLDVSSLTDQVVVLNPLRNKIFIGKTQVLDYLNGLDTLPAQIIMSNQYPKINDRIFLELRLAYFSDIQKGHTTSFPQLKFKIAECLSRFDKKQREKATLQKKALEKVFQTADKMMKEINNNK